MKLFYLSNSKIPSREANSIHVMKMCQAFTELGHEVTLLAPDVKVGIEPDVDDVYGFYGIKSNFKLRKLPWRNIKGRAWLYGLEAAREARRSGAAAAYGRCLYSCAFAARLGVPTVWDAHLPTFLRRRSERLLFRWMLRSSAFRGMTVNCGALKDHIVHAMPQLQDRITVAHNGGDVPRPAMKEVDSQATGRLKVGYVGHLYPGKGLEIIRELAKCADWAAFHVVGGQQQILDRLLRDKTLAHNVHVHGFVMPADAERLVSTFDVMLAPYQREVRIAGGGETAAWMSPLKIFNYMAAGKPIICSDLPVLREIIEHNRNGLLVSPDNAQAWVEALRDLSEDEGLRARLGRTAQEDFLARHTWKHRANRSLDCFTNVAAGSALHNAAM